MIYLDTHVVVWLYAGDTSRFPDRTHELIEQDDVLISPIVLLELCYLRGIDRITVEPALMVENLSAAIGLRYCDKPFLQVVTEAMTVEWTRDPFDRLIVATAGIGGNPLLSKDRNVLRHYPQAAWD